MLNDMNNTGGHEGRVMGASGTGGRRSILARLRGSAAGLVQALSGTAVGIRGSAGGLGGSRRGSFLVVVVGTLALLAVIMVVYVSVGQSDRRTSAAMLRAEGQDDAPLSFGSYIEEIISLDVVAVAPVKGGIVNGDAVNTPDKILAREAWDIPGTAWSLNSAIRVEPTRNTAAWFPESIVNNSDQAVLARQYFKPDGYNSGSDPWLSSTTPVWLNFDGETIPTDPVERLKKKKDWLAISNVAPDGLFVNLYNLRGNFDAKSGFSTGWNPSQVAGTGVPAGRMSDYLSLIDKNGKPTMDLAIEDTGSAWTLSFDPDISAQTSSGGSLQYTRPAIWSMYQRGAFRPVKADYESIDGKYAPDGPAYPAYQWADADGDGFFDARWMEWIDWRLTGNTDLRHVNSTLEFLPNDGNTRYFWAVKVTDLSGLVNVNTATDSVSAPTYSSPVGMNPSDVDLRRLLSGRDLALDGIDFAYSQLAQPSELLSPYDRDYENYTQLDTVAKMNKAGALGYAGLRWVLDSSVVPARGTDVTKPVASAGVTNSAPFFKRPSARLDWWDFNAGLSTIASYTLDGVNGGNGFIVGNQYQMDTQLELLTFRGVNDPLTTSRLEQAVGGRSPTGLDWSPLRENRRLDVERDLYEAANPADLNADAVEEKLLIRSGVDIRQFLTTISGSRPLSPLPLRTSNASLPGSPQNFPEESLFVRGGRSPTTSPELKYFPLDDRRLREVGVDGRFAGYENAQDFFVRYMRALAPYAGMGDDAWPAVSGNNQYERNRTTFYGYRGQELAELMAGILTANFLDSFDKDSEPTSYTLRFSAPRQSGDMIDPGSPRPGAGGESAGAEAAALDAPWFPGNSNDLRHRRLSPVELFNTGRPTDWAAPTGSQGTGRVRSDSLNVFGVEPQVFITSVGMYTVYADVPWGRGGDREPPRAVDDGGPPELGPITINGTLPWDGRTEDPTVRPKPSERRPELNDFMFRVLAVQLTNPFDRPVVLSSVDSSALESMNAAGNIGIADASASNPQAELDSELAKQDFYYIQVGERRYPLIPVEDARDGVSGSLRFTGQMRFGSTEYSGLQTLDDGGKKVFVMQPGEVRTFYVPAIPVPDIAARLANADIRPGTTYSTGTQAIVDWLNGKLDGDGTEPPVQLPKMTKDWMAENVDDKVKLTPSPLMDELEDAADTTSWVQAVHLFRTVRNGTVGDQPGEANRLRNDMLMDRFSLPLTDSDTRAEMAQTRLEAINHKIDGTLAGDNTDTATATNDNSGYMITLFNGARRWGHPGEIKKGQQIPAYCVEPKQIHINGTTFNKASQLKKTDGNKSVWESLSKSSWDDDRSTATSVSNWISEASSRNIVEFMGQDPATAWTTVFPAPDDYSNEILQTGNPTRFTGNPREWPIDNQEYSVNGVSRLRPTDLLNVMAVATLETPLNPDGTTRKPTDPKRWTTLSEMLALGFMLDERYFGAWNGGRVDDDNTTALTQLQVGLRPDVLPSLDKITGTDPTIEALFAPVYANSGQTKLRPVLDGGMLVLDYFVPFYDNSSNLNQYFDGTIAEGRGNTGERRAGLGAPLAANILDAFTTYGRKYGSGARALRGQININTAPLEVLRTLPMLSPLANVDENNQDFENDPQSPTVAFFEGAPATRKDRMDNLDVAASVFAYANRLNVQVRSTAALNPGDDVVKFFDENDVAILDNVERFARADQTGIPGLREGLGFQSIGELLAVRQVADNSGNYDPTKLGGAWNMTGLGYDGGTSPVNSSVAGLDSRMYDKSVVGGTEYNPLRIAPPTMSPGGTLESLPGNRALNEAIAVQDDLANEYDERLAIMNALASTVTVRSDIYAVHFVMAGVRRSDTEGLGADDPLVPSIQRRFVMIVDRSRVTEKAQRGRILLFKELPM